VCHLESLSQFISDLRGKKEGETLLRTSELQAMLKNTPVLGPGEGGHIVQDLGGRKQTVRDGREVIGK